MNQIDLDNQGEAIRQFFMSLPVDPEGSMIRLNGQTVARVTPVRDAVNGNGIDSGPWTQAKSARRSFLVDRKIDGTLTPEEAAELSVLQKQMVGERQRLAPLPLPELRRLHEELLTRAQGQAGHDGP